MVVKAHDAPSVPGLDVGGVPRWVPCSSAFSGMGSYTTERDTTEIVKERRGITADTACRLARYFDTTPEFWLNLQSAYDVKTLPTRAEIERRVAPREMAHA